MAKKVGRPELYTQELADIICNRLSEGESLRSVCRSDDMPDKTTVFRWFRNHPEFCAQYAKAKQEATDAMAEEILDISDNGTNDWMESNDPNNPGYKFNGDHYQRSRLRVDTRKWLMSKMKPKKYGDAILNKVSGPDGEPLQVEIIEAPSITTKI